MDSSKLKSGSKRVIYFALIGNGAIMVMKFITAAITGSSAMMAESFHSLADTGNQGLMLLGFALAQRPPDEKHPFGYGKERYFWAFIVAMSIFIVGAAFSIMDGVEKYQSPEVIRNPNLSYIVLGLAIVFESITWLAAAREFRRRQEGKGIMDTIRDSRDPAIITVLFEDTAAILGIIIAGVGIYLSASLGIHKADGIASIIIGVLLTGVAIILAFESRDFLIGESASRSDRAKVREIISTFPQVERMLELLSMYIGPEDLLLNLNLEFKDGLKTEEIEAIVDEIEAAIRETIPSAKRIFIEADSPETDVPKIVIPRRIKVPFQ